MNRTLLFWSDTKTILLVVFVLLNLFGTANAALDARSSANENRRAESAAEPRATFERLWVDYDIFENGVKGMRIHVKFSVFEMKNTDAFLAVRFQSSDGKVLKDKDGRFASPSGEVAVYRAIRPGFDPTDYEDLTVFMPYAQMDLSGGEYDLKMDVDLNYKNGELLQHLTLHAFNFKQPIAETTTTAPRAAPSATVERVWVDYNTRRDGRDGMLIHVKFTVNNLRGVDSYLAVLFQRKNGTKLTTTNSAYSSKEGQVAVYRSMKPGFDKTVYQDLDVFMPYDELRLGKGIYDLQMDIDLLYQDGTRIQHLSFYDFVYRNGVE